MKINLPSLVLFLALLAGCQRAEQQSPDTVAGGQPTNDFVSGDSWRTWMVGWHSKIRNELVGSRTTDLVEAVDYCRDLLLAGQAQGPEAHEALARLEKSGDAIAAWWLRFRATNNAAGLEGKALVQAADNIAGRRRNQSESASRSLRRLFLAGTVSDLTCSELEGALKPLLWRGRTNWIGSPASLGELSKLAEEAKPFTDRKGWEAAIRVRAGHHAQRILEFARTNVAVTDQEQLTPP